MSRDYKHVNGNKGTPDSAPGMLTGFVSGLALGLAVAAAVYVYFDMHEPPPVVITEFVRAEQEEGPDEERPVEPDVPEPTFEFYKILPNREINISEWVAEEGQETVDGAKTGHQLSNVYVLQVGSFSDYGSADRIKASLALLGVSAEIQRVVINGQDIRHRVRLGPYASVAELKRARDVLYQNNLEHMVLRLRLGENGNP